MLSPLQARRQPSPHSPPWAPQDPTKPVAVRRDCEGLLSLVTSCFHFIFRNEAPFPATQDLKTSPPTPQKPLACDLLQSTTYILTKEPRKACVSPGSRTRYALPLTYSALRYPSYRIQIRPFLGHWTRNVAIIQSGRKVSQKARNWDTNHLKELRRISKKLDKTQNHAGQLVKRLKIVVICATNKKNLSLNKFY